MQAIPSFVPPSLEPQKGTASSASFRSPQRYLPPKSALVATLQCNTSWWWHWGWRDGAEPNPRSLLQPQHYYLLKPCGTTSHRSTLVQSPASLCTPCYAQLIFAVFLSLLVSMASVAIWEAAAGHTRPSSQGWLCHSPNSAYCSPKKYVTFYSENRIFCFWGTPKHSWE